MQWLDSNSKAQGQQFKLLFVFDTEAKEGSVKTVTVVFQG